MAVRPASLKTYVLRRCIQTIPLVLGVIAINFTLIHLAPGDPATIFAGPYEVSEEYLAMVRREFGLDKPLYEQLIAYVLSVLRGNLGYSFSYRSPVFSLIVERIPATLLLTVTATVISSLVGVILGTTSSKKPYSLTDNVTTVFALVGYSMPIFWLGQMLVLAFSLGLGVLPAAGMYSLRVELTGIDSVLDVMKHLILPASALSMLELALVTRLTRASMLEILGQDFITTARSKGLDENAIVYRHGLRNALLPVVTVIGMRFGFVFGGALLTETVFAWPGLGRLMYESIFARDYPVLMGMFIIVSTMVIVASLVTDIVYGLLDPRIRY